MAKFPMLGDRWEPAEWDGETWLPLSDSVEYSEREVSEIGPRIPTPDEPWQCVPVEPTHNMLEASGYDISIEAVEAWQAMLAAAPKPEDV